MSEGSEVGYSRRWTASRKTGKKTIRWQQRLALSEAIQLASDRNEWTTGDGSRPKRPTQTMSSRKNAGGNFFHRPNGRIIHWRSLPLWCHCPLTYTHIHK